MQTRVKPIFGDSEGRYNPSHSTENDSTNKLRASKTPFLFPYAQSRPPKLSIFRQSVMDHRIQRDVQDWCCGNVSVKGPESAVFSILYIEFSEQTQHHICPSYLERPALFSFENLSLYSK